jgi:hypothetical protein
MRWVRGGKGEEMGFVFVEQLGCGEGVGFTYRCD